MFGLLRQLKACNQAVNQMSATQEKVLHNPT